MGWLVGAEFAGSRDRDWEDSSVVLQRTVCLLCVCRRLSVSRCCSNSSTKTERDIRYVADVEATKRLTGADGRLGCQDGLYTDINIDMDKLCEYKGLLSSLP